MQVKDNGFNAFCWIAVCRLHRDFRRPLVWETENARGDAAKRDAVELFLLGNVEAGPIARGQLLLLLRSWPTIGNDWSDGMDDILRRQVERWRNLCRTRRFLMALRLHNAITGLTQLDAGGGVDSVVNTAVQRNEATEELTVGGIDNGVDLQPGDVALPHLQALSQKRHCTFIDQLPLQFSVLHTQKCFGGWLRRPHIHQCPHQLLFAVEVLRDSKLLPTVLHQPVDDGVEIIKPLSSIFFRHIHFKNSKTQELKNGAPDKPCG